MCDGYLKTSPRRDVYSAQTNRGDHFLRQARSTFVTGGMARGARRERRIPALPIEPRQALTFLAFIGHDHAPTDGSKSRNKTSSVAA